MGGGKVSVPPPTAEEKALQKNQAELLALQRQIIEQQRSQNAILLPFLAEQEGFSVTTDANGNITGITKIPNALEEQGKEIQRLLGERSLKALKGELPLDPALEADLASMEREVRNKLSTQLGPGYETSSPGIETLSSFFRTAGILREGARTGQLTLAEQLGITREQQDIFRRQSSQDVLRTSAVGDPLTFAGAFGQTAKGFGQAQIPFIQHRQMQLQAASANAARSASIFGAGIGAIGSIFGAFSDRKGKENFIKISETPDGIPIYEFTLIKTGERMIGMIADEVEKIRPWAVGRRFEHDTVNYEEASRGIPPRGIETP